MGIKGKKIYISPCICNNPYLHLHCNIYVMQGLRKYKKIQGKAIQGKYLYCNCGWKGVLSEAIETKRNDPAEPGNIVWAAKCPKCDDYILW